MSQRTLLGTIASSIAGLFGVSLLLTSGDQQSSGDAVVFSGDQKGNSPVADGLAFDGDQQTGSDRVLIEGGLQTGSDALAIEGDQQDRPSRVLISGS